MWSTIGFESQKSYFEHLLKDNRLLHAYLFSGPEMIGKRKFAHELCRLANPQGATVVDADCMVIGPRVSEGESQIYIDDIRELNLFLSRKPLIGPYKMVLIDDADRLTIEASNALLKVLEEPSAYTVLILISSRPKQLLPTITSRCQEVHFLSHNTEAIEKILLSKKADEEESRLIAQLAGGRIGWAIRMVESGAAHEAISAIRDFKRLSSQGIAERFQYAKKIYEKEEYPQTVDYWLRWLHANLQGIENSASTMRNLLKLHQTISQPQYNHRMALEAFLLSL